MSIIRIKELIGGYKSVTMNLEHALKLLREIGETHSNTRDLEETKRILENFEEFYNIQVKKGKSYLTPPKDTSELIKGLVVIDKVKLIKNDNEKLVEIIFDKRFSRNKLDNYIKKQT